MIKVKKIVVNLFQTNTYFLYDDTKETIIIDPGCSNKDEENELVSFIKEKGLKPVRLINTHCHIDHILGNKFISNKYNLELEAHKDEELNRTSSDENASQFDLPQPKSPKISKYLDEGDVIKFGNSHLRVLFTPGHTVGHITLVSDEDKFIICGDVLFNDSIGRTDLPGGDYDVLTKSIKTKLFTLGDDFIVYPGHYRNTTIGKEKVSNPYL